MVVATQGALHGDQLALLLLLAQVVTEAASAADLGVHPAVAFEVASVAEIEEAMGVAAAEIEGALVEEEEELAIKEAVALVEEVGMVVLRMAMAVPHLLLMLLLVLEGAVASVVDMVGRQLTVA